MLGDTVLKGDSRSLPLFDSLLVKEEGRKVYKQMNIYKQNNCWQRGRKYIRILVQVVTVEVKGKFRWSIF